MGRPVDRLLKTFALAVLIIAVPPVCIGQNTPTPDLPTTKDPERIQAMEFFSTGKFVAAMPLFENLAADHPSDAGLRGEWAWCLLEYANTLTDPEQRKKTRIRARTVALEARQLGDKSQLLQVVIDLPEDGSDPKFSDRKDVDEAMKAAEADFAKGDLDKAREGYLRVLLIDPDQYDATLFIGDVYFKQHVYGSAGEWFARAVQIDQNRETAYRYWGDALVALDKDDEARSKFIEAVIADPYNRRSWVGLENWLQRDKLELNNVKLKDRSAVTIKDDKSVNITLDSSLEKDDPNAAAWLSYGLDRASWHTEKFEKEFPKIPRDRRTLQEEAHALNFMITVLKETKDYQTNLSKLDPSLRAVIKIQELGFLDPFVLLNRADTGIAQDYPAYRAANRQTLRRYLNEFVVPKTPSPAK